MSDATELLVRAVSRAFADGRRVLLVGARFDALQMLAEADLRELVAVIPGADPDAPVGKTGLGAPLRLRPDFAERTNSKDLIVDPDGDAPAEDVLRILKRQGVYICGARGPALDAMAHVTALTARRAQALVAGKVPTRAVVLDGGETDDLQIFLGAMHAVIAAPALVCTVPGAPDDASEPAADPAIAAALADAQTRADEAQALLQGAMAQFSDMERRLAEADTRLAEAEAARDAAMTAAEAMKARTDTVEAELAPLEARLAAAEAARDAALAEVKGHAAAAAEHASLQADYDAVRAELAERRVADRRADAVRARFEAARAAMGAEVDALRARLLTVNEQATDREAVLAERDAVRRVLGMTLTAFEATLKALAPLHGAGAPPPSSDGDAIEAWLATAQEAARRASEGAVADRALWTAAVAERDALGRRARELGAALAVLQAEAQEAAAPAPPVTVSGDAAQAAQIAALQAALDAERALRVAEQQAAAEITASAEAALTDRAALRERLGEARRHAARAELGRAALEEASRRTREELALRTRRVTDLEGMLAAHEQMHRLLNAALLDAEERRDEAQAARRLADENLRVLRLEFERRGPGGDGPETADAQRALSAALLAARQAAADAERRATAAEEHVRRLKADRAARG